MNIVNRYAFCLLHVLIGHFGVTPVPGVHYPTLNIPQMEFNRRREMLLPWAAVDYSELAAVEKAMDMDLTEDAEDLDSLPDILTLNRNGR